VKTGPKWTGRRWRRPFLATLALGGNIREACKTAGIVKQTAYNARHNDPEFAAAWDTALDDAVDIWVAEARRRAVEGVGEPVTYQGELVGVWVTRTAN
jgi:hypothetical protein